MRRTKASAKKRNAEEKLASEEKRMAVEKGEGEPEEKPDDKTKPGHVVDAVLDDVPQSWRKGCRDKAASIISMWNLMAMEKAAEPRFFKKAVDKYGIKSVDGLYALADKRFATLNSTPSPSKALDVLVMAAAFSRGEGCKIVGFLDVACGVQKHVDEEEEEEGEYPDTYPDMHHLFVEFDSGGSFGFKADEVHDALVEMFETGEDEGMIEVMEETGPME